MTIQGDRVISIVPDCDEKPCAILKDRVNIAFSPYELSALKRHFRAQALGAKEYSAQTAMRQMHNAFFLGYTMWKDRRGGIEK